MRIVGFITEYNPFHLGHKYHLEISKKLTNSTHSIAVMSGSFVQRGEPSLIDKWTKAKMAIDNGVDLVVELPFLCSVQSAEFFAFSGVSILDSLNVVDYLAFGTETGVIEPLEKIASILNEEPLYFKNALKKYLNTGLSYPKARSNALEEYIESIHLNGTHNLKIALKQSNNILGIEYLKALKRLNSTIEPIAIKRQGNDYNDISITTNIASATGIRNHLLTNEVDTIKNMVPNFSLNYLKEFYNKYNTFNSLDKYNQIFQYLFRVTASEDLMAIMDVENGLQNRLLNKSTESIDIESIIENVKTKRYPSTRIKRILIHMLANIDENTIKEVYETPINYIRVLGSNKKGLEILNKIKENSNIAIITKFADYKALNNPKIEKMLKFEEKATDLYFLGLSSEKPIVKMDYLISPYIK